MTDLAKISGKKYLFFIVFNYFLLNCLQALHACEHPSMQTTVSGGAVMVWQCYAEGITTIYASACASGTWSAPVAISSDNATCYRPELAVSSSTGNACAIWVANDLSTGAIYLQSSQYYSGSWSSPVALSLTDGSERVAMDYIVSIAGDSNETIYAAWTSYIGSAFVVRSANATMGNSWSDSASVSD